MTRGTDENHPEQAGLLQILQQPTDIGTAPVVGMQHPVVIALVGEDHIRDPQSGKYPEGSKKQNYDRKTFCEICFWCRSAHKNPSSLKYYTNQLHHIFPQGTSQPMPVKEKFLKN